MCTETKVYIVKYVGTSLNKHVLKSKLFIYIVQCMKLISRTELTNWYTRGGSITI